MVLFGSFMMALFLFFWLIEKSPTERVIEVSGFLFFFAASIIPIPSMVKSRPSGPLEVICYGVAITTLIAASVLFLGYQLSRPELWELARDWYRRFNNIVGAPATIINTAILAFVGYLLYLLKTKKLILYAYGEIIFALTSCYVAVSKTRHELNVGAATVFGAAIYLVVRGLDNRRKAIEDKAK